MENTNIKNETKVDGLKKNPEINKVEKNVVKLKSINLDPVQLVKEDSQLAPLMLKSFDEMSEDELALLPLVKCKVVIETRVDSSTNKKRENYIAMFVLADGIVKQKYLNADEVLSVRNFNPELITDGKAKVYVPLKLVATTSKKGDRMNFNYTACLSPSVYMGTSKRENKGYLDPITIKNLIVYNLNH